MPSVTITRQFGAGGSEVARRVAAALDWTLIDNQFVDEVARRAGLPAAVVAAHEERAPSLNERLVRALALSSPEMVVPSAEDSEDIEEEKLERVTERVIAEAAAQGRVVIVGRGAQYVLAKAAAHDTFSVWVTAPRTDRIRTVAARLQVPPAKAEQTMNDVDAARDRYVQKWHGRVRADPANYHLVVNTGALGYDGAADLIVAAVKQRGWS